MDPRVLLINPNQMKPVVAPLALDYLAESLTHHNIDFKLLDLAFSEDVETDIKHSVSERDFSAIALTVRNIDDSYFLSRDFCLEKTKAIIQCIKRHTQVPIIVGGVGFSIAPVPVLRYCGAEFGIWGEGEWSLPLLVRSLSKATALHTIPGLVYREGSSYRINPPSYPDLYTLRLSQRDAVDNLRYYREGGMIGFESKRGCDQGCYYCADPLAKGEKVRVRNPKDVADELAHLAKKKITCFHTCDSEFNVPASHAIDVCKELVRNKLASTITWYAYASPFGFSEELALWMKRAGCVGIDFGVDSGHDRILKSLGRRHTSDDLRGVAALCRAYGFAFMFDLLLGGPGEDRSTVRETIELMRQLNPTRVGISLGLRLYQGTRFGKILGEETHAPQRALFGEPSSGMLKPFYYLTPDLGPDIQEYIRDLIAGDRRFLFGGSEDIGEDYNYNNNSKLVQAIKDGYKGAFWDILRRLEEAG
ncbi:MAG: radical SAM protein [Deltaproteobacteria bacterium]|nr:radical SAM protein [Deltaproteobacteria bacterium]